LDTIELVQSPIRTLEGIEHFHRIKHCEFHYLPELREVKAIAGTGVMHVHLDHCKNVQDIEALGKAKSLRVLRVTNCGNLRSLHFISSLENLEELRFVGTNIVDGDMSPLFRLKKVGFFPKKHYNRTPEEVDSEIARAALRENNHKR
jgi:hypothetical protein